MIPYIHTQLAAWGRHVVRASIRGLGFPSTSPMFRDAPPSVGFGSAAPVGVRIGGQEDIDDMDKAVKRLSRQDQSFVVEYYVAGGSAVDIAARLSISRQSLYRRLDSLHCALLGLLNDVVAGC